jgi:hypothetical protein
MYSSVTDCRRFRFLADHLGVNTLSLAFNSDAVKILRFLTTNLSGAIPTYGAVVGPAVSLIDFTLSELLSKPHVTAFIDDLYPSLFERG